MYPSSWTTILHTAATLATRNGHFRAGASKPKGYNTEAPSFIYSLFLSPKSPSAILYNDVSADHAA